MKVGFVKEMLAEADDGNDQLGLQIISMGASHQHGRALQTSEGSI